MDSRAGSLALVGGLLALDFANTSGARDTADPIEHLQQPTHLVDWALHAGAVDTATALRCRSALARQAGDGAPLLAQALRLREAIYRTGAAIAGGGQPAATDLATLKDLATAALGPATLKAAGNGCYRFDFQAAPVELALLGPIAWSACDLLARGGFERLKQCPGPACGWLFLDQTRNNSRRWCDMATCGNRTKGRRHRERHPKAEFGQQA